MPLVLSGDGSVGPLSATEVGYLDGVTSAVQTQIDGRVAASDGSVTGSLSINGIANNSGPAREILRGEGTVNNGFYHREVFRISGIGPATELTRLTMTGSNGFQAYFKIIVTGHTGTITNGTNIKEFYWGGGTGAPVQISTYTTINPPVITFNNSTNNVLIVNLASADGSNSFNGVAMVEWLIPLDFSGSTATIS